MTACVLNQLGGHWLLYDALNYSITLSLRMREKARIQPTFDPLMEELPLSCLCWPLILEKRFMGILTLFLHS